jgi:hypothetical protein
MEKELILGPDDCEESKYSINGFLEELSIIGEVTDRHGAPLDSHNFNDHIVIKPNGSLKEAREHFSSVSQRYNVRKLKVIYSKD